MNLYNMSRLAVNKVLQGHSPDPFILETLVEGLDQHLADNRSDSPTWYALTNTAFLLSHFSDVPLAATANLEETVQGVHRFSELKKRALSFYRKAETMLNAP